MLSAEWSYVLDENGVVYCRGRDFGNSKFDAVASYYQDKRNTGPKVELEGEQTYTRHIFQGLPEEYKTLSLIGDTAIKDALAQASDPQNPGLILSSRDVTEFDSRYRAVPFWLSTNIDKAKKLQESLGGLINLFVSFGIDTPRLCLYGSASFGLVDRTDKEIEDIDIVFPGDMIGEMKVLVEELGTEFAWSEVDPLNRLAPARKLCKTKRWDTSQLRIPIDGRMTTVDLKVARSPESHSGWDNFVESENTPFFGELSIVDDREAFSTSPVFLCEDRKGRILTLLADGYQYIGTAVQGDVITVIGNEYPDQSAVRVMQVAQHQIIPDFSKVKVN